MIDRKVSCVNDRGRYITSGSQTPSYRRSEFRTRDFSHKLQISDQDDGSLTLKLFHKLKRPGVTEIDILFF